MFLNGGFTLVPAAHAVEYRTIIPEATGVYALLLRRGERLLDAAGYYDCPLPHPLVHVGEFVHLYSGCSGSIGTRIRNHLVGDKRVSNFRRTLLSLEGYCGAMSAIAPFQLGANEENDLTAWLSKNLMIAFQSTSDHLAVERGIITNLASPLNIQCRRPLPFARRLMAILRLWDGRPMAGWLQEALN